MEIKNVIKLAKNKIRKIEENLNEIVEHCLKWNECKFLTRNVLYDLLLVVSAKVRADLGYIYIYIYIYISEHNKKED